MERAVVRGEGVDVVLALDASESMLAQDERPSRLERMKQEVRRLRALSPNDRMALVAFAGRSYILSPLTIDDGAIALFLDNLDPSIVGQGGSSLARTIRQGTELLTATESTAGRALVVMSDGETWDEREDVLDAARKADAAGVTLVTVGFGTTNGATIPVREGDMTVQKRDEAGDVVVTRYDPSVLRAAAEAANGRFVAADATDKAGRVRDALNRLRTQERKAEESRLLTPRFQWFLLPALLLVFLDTLLTDRVRARRPTGRRLTAVASGAALLLATLPAPARADTVRDAARAYRDGHYVDAVALYRRAIEEGDRRPELLYNLGTALLAADSLPQAAEVLERVTGGAQGDLRQRALYNLGLARLRMGLGAQGDEAAQALDGALAAYKQVLLAQPADSAARWNYELALREKQKGGGGGGGGGGGENQPNPSGGAGGDQPTPGKLGQSQAEQLLNSAAREERAVQGKKQRQTAPDAPRHGKDW
jgi:Ca-activated chloride channel family protein